MSSYKSNILTLPQQVLRLKSVQPNSTVRFDQRGNRMIWIGKLQPTVLSESYQTRIVCSKSQMTPLVFIDSPLLANRGGDAIPHRYKDGNLCLWQPAYHEWQPSFWISETIIGWASLWLFFYELWHACGEWLGGGEHPAV